MSATTYLELVLPAVPASVPKARNQAGAAVASLGSRLADDVRLCVSEAVTNVVRHAYGKTGGEVEVRIESEDGEVSVRVSVRDTGK
jgi:anti-sigma regulatory factor (Ser/Thr protein kinase)